MKKIYFLPFMLLMIGNAALCASLSGTYTIGGASPNYATFNLAVTALVSNGVSGPVIFNVRPGTYTEQITISSVTGTSGSNTITFQSSTGKSGDVNLTYGATGTNNNWVVNLNGASYIIFNAMTLQATGATYSNVVYMNSSASNDTVKNSTITAPSTTTSTTNQVLINMCADGTNCNYNGAYNDTLYNGSYGIYSNFSYYGGVSYNFALYVVNNVFINQYAYGLYNFRALNCTIKYNTMTSNSTSSYYGIWVGIAFGDSIGCNKISNCPGNGIWYDNGEPHIFNNFVEIVGSGTNYGITFTDMNENGTTPEITYNSVLVLNTNSNSSAFYIPTGYDQPVNYMHDNAFINRGGGYAVDIVETGEVSNPNGWGIHAVFDYNDLYTTGSYIGNWGGTNCTTFANWQGTISSCGCGGDSHSVNINPGFVSNTDLHLTADDLRYGTPDIEVGYDIDNQGRNAVTPDIGADEFTGISNVPQFTANQTSVCPGSTVNFTDQTNNSPTAWKWTFTGGTPDTSTSKNPSITYNTPGNYNVQLIVTNSIGTDTLLKSGYITVEPAAVAGNISATPDSICYRNNTQLSATGSTGSLLWQSSDTNSNFQMLNAGPDSIVVLFNVPAPFYFRVIATNGSCSDTSGSKLVFINPSPMPLISTSDSLICSSDSTLITVNNDYSSYIWNKGDTANHIYVNAAGSYFVAVANVYGCLNVSNVINISVFPVPSVSLEINVDTLSSLNAVAYQWYHGDTAITGATNPFYIVKQTGYYSVQITDTNGCKTQSTQQYITATGIKSLLNSNDISVYPNPFGNKLFIQRSNIGTKWDGIEIYDVVGQRIINESSAKFISNTIELDVSALPAGLYYVKITAGETRQVWKVVKQ